MEASYLIGCKLRSNSSRFRVSGIVEIDQAYLNTLEPGDRSLAIDRTISQQLKYLVGISREFHTSGISKIAVSSFRDQAKIDKQQIVLTRLPELDLFWQSQRGIGEALYVKFLFGAKTRTRRTLRISYHTDIFLFSCAKEGISTKTIGAMLGKLPIPLDPYLGVWLNSRHQRQLLPSRQGGMSFVPDCFARDFADFGTPEQAWFFWSPVFFAKNRHCGVDFSRDRVANFQIEPIEEQAVPVASLQWGSIFRGLESKGALFFGVQYPGSGYAASFEAFALSVFEALKECPTLDVNACMTILGQVERSKLIAASEIGARNLVLFLKYLVPLLKIEKVKFIEKSDHYFVLNLTGKAFSGNKRLDLRIYYGPTSLHNDLLGPVAYWTLLDQSLHESDFIFYLGHSGLGDNLTYKNIKMHSAYLEKIRHGDHPLLLGIFSCEALSYFGHDLAPLFKSNLQMPPQIVILSSSGIEINPLFPIALVESIFDKVPISQERLTGRLARYVNSYEFIAVQQIRY